MSKRRLRSDDVPTDSAKRVRGDAYDMRYIDIGQVKKYFYDGNLRLSLKIDESDVSAAYKGSKFEIIIIQTKASIDFTFNYNPTQAPASATDSIHTLSVTHESLTQVNEVLALKVLKEWNDEKRKIKSDQLLLLDAICTICQSYLPIKMVLANYALEKIDDNARYDELAELMSSMLRNQPMTVDTGVIPPKDINEWFNADVERIKTKYLARSIIASSSETFKKPEASASASKSRKEQEGNMMNAIQVKEIVKNHINAYNVFLVTANNLNTYAQGYLKDTTQDKPENLASIVILYHKLDIFAKNMKKEKLDLEKIFEDRNFDNIYEKKEKQELLVERVKGIMKFFDDDYRYILREVRATCRSDWYADVDDEDISPCKYEDLFIKFNGLMSGGACLKITDCETINKADIKSEVLDLINWCYSNYAYIPVNIEYYIAAFFGDFIDINHIPLDIIEVIKEYNKKCIVQGGMLNRKSKIVQKRKPSPPSKAVKKPKTPPASKAVKKTKTPPASKAVKTPKAPPASKAVKKSKTLL